MSDTYQAISRVDEGTGEPFIGTCTLVMGDGTQKVEFRKGRATVPADLAHFVDRHPNIDVIGYEGGNGTPVPVGAQGALAGSELQAVVDGQAARIAELEALVKGLAAGQAQHTAPATGKPRQGHEAKLGVDNEHVLVGDGEEIPEHVRLAMEHLEQEGEDVPDPGSATTPAPSREGWEATTGDGQPRCQAAKADGGQCNNQATTDQACQLAKHQEQLKTGGDT